MSYSLNLTAIATRKRNRNRYSAFLVCALSVSSAVYATAQAGIPPPEEMASAKTVSSAPELLPDAPLPQTASPVPPNQGEDVSLRNTPIHVLKDQVAIWTSPVRIRTHDFVWLVPLGLATTVSLTADHQAMSSVVSHDPLFNHENVVASDVLTGAFIAAPVALFSEGQFRSDQHARESGILSGEALVDGVVVEQGMKLVFWRERPSADQSKGKFFQRSAGTDSSFPSSHSLLAWSSASVIAHEYPQPWVQVTAYTLATGVSLTRVLGQEHFPTDVLIGSAAGWLVGHYVYHRHHKVWMQ